MTGANDTTPRPWHVGFDNENGVFGEDGTMVCDCHKPADAALIVGAVNAKHSFAAALKEHLAKVENRV